MVRRWATIVVLLSLSACSRTGFDGRPVPINLSDSAGQAEHTTDLGVEGTGEDRQPRDSVVVGDVTVAGDGSLPDQLGDAPRDVTPAADASPPDLCVPSCLDAGCGQADGCGGSCYAACSPNQAWVETFGGASAFNQAIALAATDGGDLVAVGTVGGPMDFGGGTLPYSSGNDVLIASYDAAGTHRWSRAFGSTGQDDAFDVVIDGSGNVLVVGSYQGSVSFGGAVLTSTGGSIDIFVASYTSSGTHRFSWSFGSAGDDAGNAIAVDAAGRITIEGTLGGAIDFGGGPTASSGLFLASFDGAGRYRWSQSIGPARMQATGITADGNGNVTAGGTYRDAVDFGDGLQVITSGRNAFVASYDSSGGFRWKRVFGSGTFESSYAVVSNAGGKVATLLYGGPNIDMGGGPLASSTGTPVVAIFDASGAHLASWRAGNVDTFPNALAMDRDDNITLAGEFRNTVTFGGSTYVALQSDAFVARFTGSGSHLWSRHYGGSGFLETGNSVAVTGDGSTFVFGSFDEAIDFGAGPVTTTGLNDLFLLALSPL